MDGFLDSEEPKLDINCDFATLLYISTVGFFDALKLYFNLGFPNISNYIGAPDFIDTL